MLSRFWNSLKFDSSDEYALKKGIYIIIIIIIIYILIYIIKKKQRRIKNKAKFKEMPSHGLNSLIAPRDSTYLPARLNTLHNKHTPVSLAKRCKIYFLNVWVYYEQFVRLYLISSPWTSRNPC